MDSIYNEDGQKMVWVTKEGTNIPYDQLTDNHIKNILNMLENSYPSYPCFNGDMAQYNAENQYDILCSRIDRLIFSLKAERKRRINEQTTN